MKSEHGLYLQIACIAEFRGTHVVLSCVLSPGQLHHRLPETFAILTDLKSNPTPGNAHESLTSVRPSENALLVSSIAETSIGCRTSIREWDKGSPCRRDLIAGCTSFASATHTLHCLVFLHLCFRDPTYACRVEICLLGLYAAQAA